MNSLDRRLQWNMMHDQSDSKAMSGRESHSQTLLFMCMTRSFGLGLTSLDYLLVCRGFDFLNNMHITWSWVTLKFEDSNQIVECMNI